MHEVNALAMATAATPDEAASIQIAIGADTVNDGRTRLAYLEFVADANADIVRGLIAVLQRLFSGQRAGDVLDFNIEYFFRQIGLDQFVSSQRRNGLAGMVSRIRSEAKAILKGTPHPQA